MSKLDDYVKLNELAQTLTTREFQIIYDNYDMTGKLVIPDTSRVGYVPYNNDFNELAKELRNIRNSLPENFIFETPNGDVLVYRDAIYVKGIRQSYEEYVLKHYDDVPKLKQAMERKSLPKLSEWKKVNNFAEVDAYYQHEFDDMYEFLKSEANKKFSDEFWFSVWYEFTYRKFIVHGNRVFYENKQKEITTLKELIDEVDKLW